MADRSRGLSPLIFATALVLLANPIGAQEVVQPQPPPNPPSAAPFSGPAATTPAETQPAKPLSKKEVDALLEKAFGPGSEELKRPIRLWIGDVGMAIAAKEAKLEGQGTVTFLGVSLGFPFEKKIVHGDEFVVHTPKGLTEIGHLATQSFFHGQLRMKSGLMILEANGPVPAPSAPPGAIEERVRVTTKMVPVTETTILPSPPPLMPSQQANQNLRVVFKFDIEANAPLAALLPTPPKSMSKKPSPFNEDLSKVAEIMFGEPMQKTIGQHKAMESTAHAIAKINHANLHKTDGFMLAMIDQRPDLRGLPFLMGEECRSREDRARAFAVLAEGIQQMLRQAKRSEGRGADELNSFWKQLVEANILLPNISEKGELASISQESFQSATVAALMQILMPESEKLRLGLTNYLSTVPHVDATKALAKLAIFSPEAEVRNAAITALRVRRDADYTDVLLQGLHYPLPAVAKRSAEAIVKLERKDMVPQLVAALEQTDPRMPISEHRDGKDVATVRELVKVNHHRNCLLCHSPGNTENIPAGVLKVAVPLPTEPLPKPSEGGYQTSPPHDMLVRLDTTYLRQDFSLMMPVADAHPWPEMQRFDFLVRTRALTPAEAQEYEAMRPAGEPGRLSEYHRAALFALRELTGRDAEPTPQAWRKLLNLPKGS